MPPWQSFPDVLAIGKYWEQARGDGLAHTRQTEPPPGVRYRFESHLHDRKIHHSFQNDRHRHCVIIDRLLQPSLSFFAEILLDFLVWNGAKICKSCGSRKLLQNDFCVAKKEGNAGRPVRAAAAGRPAPERRRSLGAADSEAARSRRRGGGDRVGE